MNFARQTIVWFYFSISPSKSNIFFCRRPFPTPWEVRISQTSKWFFSGSLIINPSILLSRHEFPDFLNFPLFFTTFEFWTLLSAKLAGLTSHKLLDLTSRLSSHTNFWKDWMYFHLLYPKESFKVTLYICFLSFLFWREKQPSQKNGTLCAKRSENNITDQEEVWRIRKFVCQTCPAKQNGDLRTNLATLASFARRD